MPNLASTAWKNTIIIAIACGFAGFAFYYLGSILLPFAAGALLAYLSDPLVNQLMRLKISRWVAVSIVFVLLFFIIFLLILLLIPLIQKQVAMLGTVIPAMYEWVQDKFLPMFMKYFGMENTQINDVKQLITSNVSKAGNVAHFVLQTTVQSGKALFEIITNIILIPVVTFYLLRDWELLLGSIKRSIPPRLRPTVIEIVKECDEVLSAFFRGQFLVMLSLGIIYSFGLSLVGLQIGVIIGIIAGFLSVVPYLGSIIGFLIALIAALVQFGTFPAVIGVVLVFIIGQCIEGMILTPILIGDRIGLHPVAVIFAVLAGGALFGFLGILLALPVAAVIMVLVRHINRQYHRSELYKS